MFCFPNILDPCRRSLPEPISQFCSAEYEGRLHSIVGVRFFLFVELVDCKKLQVTDYLFETKTSARKHFAVQNTLGKCSQQIWLEQTLFLATTQDERRLVDLGQPFGCALNFGTGQADTT